ncbi:MULTISPECIES: amino acid ABC transporter permease [unclassified Phycicoccus]|uniref:amino acid ABC transporter permease n=1 Tax=unclassified Phycicoccus TaxID=2637926 RepID=UPI00070249F9|nr:MULTISPECIES: amino acid ABC transporter permease [unclassified Phycicoccus]KRF22738.1 glutamate ABC transporter permease [Phycicoccus sp. Soil802]KRF24582.1 glutamate ABC transporter permease [Phycicoccus sp. Soil803]
MGDILSNYGPEILRAFWVTIRLALVAGIGSLVIGTLVAVMRLSPVRVLRLLGTWYVNVFRNTPLTLLMVFSILGLTYILGLNLDQQDITQNALRWSAVMLSIYHAAFVCEALRSGVNTVPVGQAEASRSIGLTFSQSMREVILPQAFRGAVAPLGSNFIALIKNTTVTAVIVAAEAGGLMQKIIENETGTLSVFLIFAIGFVILTLPLGVFFTSLSRRLAVKR